MNGDAMKVRATS